MSNEIEQVHVMLFSWYISFIKVQKIVLSLLRNQVLFSEISVSAGSRERSKRSFIPCDPKSFCNLWESRRSIRQGSLLYSLVIYILYHLGCDKLCFRVEIVLSIKPYYKIYANNIMVTIFLETSLFGTWSLFGSYYPEYVVIMANFMLKFGRRKCGKWLPSWLALV